MVALMLHTLTHLSPLWHASTGPRGWWVWAQWHNGMDGYGVVANHLVAVTQTKG